MPAQIAVLLVPLQHATDDHIVQIGGVDAGALDQLTQRLTQQINGVPFLQAPAARPRVRSAPTMTGSWSFMLFSCSKRLAHSA